MQNRTRRKRYVPAWQIEYANAYRKYLQEFKSSKLNNYQPLTLGRFTIFKSGQDLNKEFKKKQY